MADHTPSTINLPLPGAFLPAGQLEQAERLFLAIHEATADDAETSDPQTVAFALACVAGRLTAFFGADRETAVQQFVAMLLEAVEFYSAEADRQRQDTPQ